MTARWPVSICQGCGKHVGYHDGRLYTKGEHMLLRHGELSWYYYESPTSTCKVRCGICGSAVKDFGLYFIHMEKKHHVGGGVILKFFDLHQLRIELRARGESGEIPERMQKFVVVPPPSIRIIPHPICWYDSKCK